MRAGASGTGSRERAPPVEVCVEHKRAAPASRGAARASAGATPRMTFRARTHRLVWILSGETFNTGSSEQIVIGGDKYEAGQNRGGGKRSGKLHRIIAAQT